MSRPIVILGPQRPRPNLSAALEAHEVRGSVAVITAGWRYDEDETAALWDHLPQETVHLPLYRWFDELMAAAPDLRAAWRARQERILSFKALHRTRLGYAYRAVVRLGRAPVEDPVLHEAELQDAVRALRQLDDRVLELSREIKAASGLARQPWTHPAAARFHARVREALGHCDALLVAGGHVAVLLNRMEAFGLGELLGDFHRRGGLLVGWSAGAMVLGDRVVLYYDDPPEGPSEPEVLDAGFGLLGDLSVFPHARQRLRMGDRDRLRLLQARFGRCRALENGAWLELDEHGAWTDRSEAGTAAWLAPDGVPEVSTGSLSLRHEGTALLRREETVERELDGPVDDDLHAEGLVDDGRPGDGSPGEGGQL